MLDCNDIDIDNSNHTRCAAHMDMTYEPAASWLRTNLRFPLLGRRFLRADDRTAVLAYP